MQNAIRVLIALVSVLALVFSASADSPRAPEVRPVELTPLRVVEKTGGRISRDGLTSTVVVKFREGSRVRLANGGLDLAAMRSKTPALIASIDLARRARPTFDRSADELRAEESKLESATGQDLADLSLYLDIEAESPSEAERLARGLESSADVEFAYVRPAPLPPAAFASGDRGSVDTGTTPDFSSLQFYLDSAPGGFGARTAWTYPGNRGRNVRIVDIEYSWNVGHEDLPFTAEAPFVYVEGVDPFPDDRASHGTAVVGMLAGVDNGFGITGICPEAKIGLINPVRGNNDYRLAAAIDQASDILTRDGARGDIIQIEQQARGINDEFAALPPEWDPAVFDAIQRAVAKGVVVVEPAGNGGFTSTPNGGIKAQGANLDDSRLGGAFNRKKKDSGAIIVGGAFPVDSTHAPTSNYGKRVDVQGHGVGVCTLGYGNLWNGGSLLTMYTNNFGGTSSATACVTGVAALVQSALRDMLLQELPPALLRAVLAGTGSPDGSIKSEPVGPRPDAATSVPRSIDPATPFITGIAYKAKKDRLTIDGLYFKGLDFPAGERSVVLINEQPVETEYTTEYNFNGTTTRLTVTGGVAALMPRNQLSYISIQTGDVVSPRRIFVRK